eukprot:365932-Chlamydomonas_euryale.AAC.7
MSPADFTQVRRRASPRTGYSKWEAWDDDREGGRCGATETKDMPHMPPQTCQPQAAFLTALVSGRFSVRTCGMVGQFENFLTPSRTAGSDRTLREPNLTPERACACACA